MGLAPLYFVPQAWTLGIELVVYLLAPWLFSRSPWIIAAVTAASLVARAVGYQSGLCGDPWDHRFFPFELALFGAGALAFRLAPPKFRRSKLVGATGAFLIAMALASYQFLPTTQVGFSGFRFNQAALLVLVVVFIAPLFELSTTLSWDRRLGELSYPIYLGHLLVIQMLGGRHGPANAFVLVGTILFASGLLLLSRPFEKLRSRNSKQIRAEVQSTGIAVPRPPLSSQGPAETTDTSRQSPRAARSSASTPSP